MTGCPSTSAAVKASSDKLNCTPSLVYHCLRDQAGHLTQKCIKPSWIQKGHCAEYNTVARRLDAKACTPTRGLCPDKPYLSNDVLSFSGCAPTESEPSQITTAISTDIQTESSVIDVFTVVIPVIVLFVLVCIGLGVAVFTYYRKKQQGNHDGDGESRAPLTMDDLNESEEKRKKKAYLKEMEGSLKYFKYKDTCTKDILERTKERLQNNNNVVIVGKPGSGKTTLAWSVCKQMHGEINGGKMWHVTVSTDTENIPDGSEIILLLIDGSFENGWASKETIGKDLGNVEEFRSKLPGKQIITIVTISKHAYRRIEKFDCFKRFKPWEIIDLDDKENCFTILDMSKVFETYDISIRNVAKASDYNVLSQKQLQSVYDCFQQGKLSIKHQTPKLGFPLIASLMAINSEFHGNVDFVKEPIHHILKSTKELKESGKYDERNKYFTLVYAAFNGGYVDKSKLKRDLLRTIGTQHGIQEADFNTDFYLLRERRCGLYEFVHESIMQAFLAAYGKQNLDFVIKHCPLDVLLEYCVSERGKIPEQEESFYLMIGTKFEKSIATRIINENFEIRYHMMWEHNDFQTVYRKMYSKTNALNDTVKGIGDTQ